MVGTTLSHYRIVERIGQGGMGVVYRARDERLERDIALKVLPEGAFADPEAQSRFRHEALALSSLNHPAIATIHDFDSQDGVDFLVMEYVEGETLDARIGRGPLRENDVVGLGAQIADALSAAHERKLVHRDLKPGNILVTPGDRVKLLDFGIAFLLQPEGVASTTGSRTGTLMGFGTLAYMSPEQLLGSSVDTRSDLFSLGVVLYQMSTGRLPYQAKLSTALVYEVTSISPPAPGRYRPDLSTELEAIVLKCLEKNPDFRYQSSREIAADLKRLAAAPQRRGASANGHRDRVESLVVLPLVNLSGDPEQEYFADGMTDALIEDLAQIEALRVISRTTAMRYKSANKPLPEIARELNVDAVVEGTVLRVGERVRISAQLIEAASDRHLWSRSYERDFSDVLGMQGEVAAAIAGEIRVTLTPLQQARLVGALPVDPRAQEAYLRGRFLWNKRNVTDVRRSIDYFKQAIEADPTYALAYAGLADAYNILGDQNALTPEAANNTAKAAAARALELDAQLAEAHTAVGFIRMFYEWRWEEAEEAFRKAIAFKPNYATTHQWYAELLVSQERFVEAEAEARRALELDPLSLIIGTTLGDVFYFSRRYEEAIRQLRRTLDLDPGFVPTHSDLGRALAQRGHFDKAIDEFLAAARLSGSDPDASAGLGHAYAGAGKRDEALRVAAKLESLREQRYVSPHSIATIYTALGEIDRALEWLETAYQERDRALVWVRVHPKLDSLREDPRFADLRSRMRL